MCVMGNVTPLRKGIFIAVPSRHGVRPETSLMLTHLMLMLAVNLPGSELVLLPGSSDIRVARSDLAYEFLKSGCQRLLFVDDDLVFELEDVVHLYNAHGHIVGLPYKRRTPPHAYAIRMPDGVKHPVELPKRMCGEKLFLEVMAVGCGAMMIDRRVVESMYEKHSELDYYIDTDEGRRCLLFQAGIYQAGGKPRSFGEDFSFCFRAREDGFKTEILVQAKTDHAGVLGNFAENFERVAA